VLKAAVDGSIQGGDIAIADSEGDIVERRRGTVPDAGDDVLQLDPWSPAGHVQDELVELAPADPAIVAEVLEQEPAGLRRGTQPGGPEHVVDQPGEGLALVAIAGESNTGLRALEEKPKRRFPAEIARLDQHERGGRRARQEGPDDFRLRVAGIA